MRQHLIMFVMACIAVPTLTAQAQQLYRWVDKDGVVHYGDRIPPEYAGNQRDVLNDQAIAVRSEAGALSEAELAEQARLREVRAIEQQAREEAQRRDRMLLATYLSVADIESVRDQRLGLLESQITVTQQYVANLKQRLQSLHRERNAYSPYSQRENAPPVPEQLALEISRTEASIRNYEQNVTRTRAEQETLRAAFDADIARFKELRGI